MNTPSLKTLLIVSLATVLISGNVLAQHERGDRGKHHGPPDAETRVAHMTRSLDLTDEQSAEMLQLMQAVDQEREALHQKMMTQMEPEICDLQLRVEADTINLLTDEQLAKYESRKDGHDSKRSEYGGRGMRNLDCSAYE